MTRLDIVVPVRDEAHVLEPSVRRLHAFLSRLQGFDWTIIIAENGSRDGTRQEAQRICGLMSNVRLVTLDLPGRGRALREAWTSSDAQVVGYVDVDHSTDLEDLPRLVVPVAADRCDIAVASRRLPGSRVTRSFKRQLISDAYNRLLALVLGVGFSDAQAGCKMLHRRVVEKVLPDVLDQSWFLDTELLVLAERRGYRISDIPVTWVEDDDSRVQIVSTAWQDLCGIARLWWQLPGGARRRTR